MPTATTTTTDREVTMSNFTATVMASTASEAIDRVAKHLAKCEGFSLTGRVQLKSERHGLWDVEVANLGGNVNDCWVVLTSYGISPSKGLRSTWQQVAGVGR